MFQRAVCTPLDVIAVFNAWFDKLTMRKNGRLHDGLPSQTSRSLQLTPFLMVSYLELAEGRTTHHRFAHVRAERTNLNSWLSNGVKVCNSIGHNRVLSKVVHAHSAYREFRACRPRYF
ncbi:hypothetical protein ABIC60_004366 [Phyllobacterium ifriqiyense]